MQTYINRIAQNNNHTRIMHKIRFRSSFTINTIRTKYVPLPIICCTVALSKIPLKNYIWIWMVENGWCNHLLQFFQFKSSLNPFGFQGSRVLLQKLPRLRKHSCIISIGLLLSVKVSINVNFAWILESCTSWTNRRHAVVAFGSNTSHLWWLRRMLSHVLTLPMYK